MGLPVIVSNYFRYMVGKKAVDLDADVFYCCLMGDAFTFDPDNHQVYGDVSTLEVAAGNGYATGGQALTGAYSQDNDADLAVLDFDDFSWVADGGTIANIGSILVYNGTVSNLIVCCGPFASGISLPAGLSLDLSGVGVEL